MVQSFIVLPSVGLWLKGAPPRTRTPFAFRFNGSGIPPRFASVIAVRVPPVGVRLLCSRLCGTIPICLNCNSIATPKPKIYFRHYVKFPLRSSMCYETIIARIGRRDGRRGWAYITPVFGGGIMLSGTIISERCIM